MKKKFLMKLTAGILVIAFCLMFDKPIGLMAMGLIGLGTDDGNEDETVTLTKEDLKDIIGTSVKTAIESMGLNKVHNKYENGMSDDERFKDPAYTIHALLCAIKAGDKSRITEINQKAASPMTEGVAGDGGYLVPAQTVATILEMIPSYGQGRKFMETIPMGKVTTLNIPKYASGLSVTWVNENSSISDNKMTLGQIQLLAKKAAGIVVISNELLLDANVNIGQFILKKFAQKFGTAEDIQFFNGTGSPFTGIFASANTFGNAVDMSGQIGTLAYSDLLDCLYGIDSSYLNGAAWYMHRTVMAQIRKISDDQSRPIIIPGDASTPTTLLGYPVRIIENAPAGSADPGTPIILLGNLENSYIGTKNELSVKILDEASIGGTSLAENDLSAIRVIERVGFDKGMTEAYSVIKLAGA